jgi:thymidylate synthase
MTDIPVLHVTGITLAGGFEKALFELYSHGMRIKTQYDKPGDPLSIDATMNITYLEPDKDPMIHKAFPGGIEDLKEYVMELEGAKDHWVKCINDPSDTRWEYTYHGRLAGYGTWKNKYNGYSEVWMGTPFNQVEAVVAKLAAEPFTRQAQMITWMPKLDLKCYDPPCLQSIWFRMTEDDGTWYLNTNIRFRSNDAWGAHFMNVFGFVQFIKDLIIEPLQAMTDHPIKMGRINWQADSFHIYGKDIQQAEERLFNRVKKPLEGIASRVYSLSDPMIQEIYNEAEPKVIAKIKAVDEERAHGSK